MSITLPATRRDFIRTAALGAASLPAVGLLPACGGGTESPFAGYDATGLAELVRSGQATPAELLEDTIRKIEAVNPKLNAVIAKAYERARVRAATLGKAGGGGAFAGVPWLIKDITECKGLPMTMGSRALRGAVSQVDVPFITTAEAAGLNIVGVTNVPEFGLSDSSRNALYGVTRNPWNTALSASGSSAGSAAAVAAGIVPMAHGNDGGGSLRCPASACGLFTLKASRGRLLAAHTQGLPYDIGQDGVLSRSVRDNARLLSLVEDRSAALPPMGHVAGPSGRKLKIGVLVDLGGGLAPEPAVARAMAETVRLCEDLGHTVAPVALPFDYGGLIDAFWGVWMAGAALTVDAIAAATGLPANEANFEAWTLGLRADAMSRPGGPMALLGAAGPVFQDAGARMDAFLQGWDAVLTPVYRCPTDALGSREVSASQSYAQVFETFARQAPYTEMHNACGTPAMSVPLHWDANGLPIGSQFFARVGAEATLLGLAYELEQARPWAARRPQMSAG